MSPARYEGVVSLSSGRKLSCPGSLNGKTPLFDTVWPHLSDPPD